MTPLLVSFVFLFDCVIFALELTRQRQKYVWRHFPKVAGSAPWLRDAAIGDGRRG